MPDDEEDIRMSRKRKNQVKKEVMQFVCKDSTFNLQKWYVLKLLFLVLLHK